MGTRGFEVDEERMLAGRLAGVLFLTAGGSCCCCCGPGRGGAATGAGSPRCPGCAWPGRPIAWCSRARMEHGAWFWHTPAILSIPLISGLIASTGGAESPARFMVFFLLFYTCYFYSAGPRAPVRRGLHRDRSHAAAVRP